MPELMPGSRPCTRQICLYVVTEAAQHALKKVLRLPAVLGMASGCRWEGSQGLVKTDTFTKPASMAP